MSVFEEVKKGVKQAISYEKLIKAVDELRPYYDIDKIKPYGVYVWMKTDYQNNVFDIYKNEIYFYNRNHKIPEEALPIIRKIQELLLDLEGE